VNVKIGLLGNMNNGFFPLTRFIREKGFDAELLMFDDEFNHFHPSADSYDLDFMNYCRQLSWGSSRNFNSVSKEQIRQDIQEYAILIGCGLAPAYCEKINRRLDIFIPYGDDIWAETFYRVVNPYYLFSVNNAVCHQRRGIKNCRIVNSNIAFYETQLKKYQGRAERWTTGYPFLFTSIYDSNFVKNYSDKTHWGFLFRKIREENEFLIFYHSRHVWACSEKDWNHKGTDSLLKGFALFLKKSQKVKAKILTLEYGSHVKQSKELIRELGIESSVIWMPKMYRKDLMIGLALSDIVCGQFTHSTLSFGSVCEGLALAKPILGHRRDEEYKSIYMELYPMMNAKSPEEIAKQLELYIENPDKFKLMGMTGRAWLDKYFEEQPMEKFVNYFNSVEKGNIGYK